MLNQITIMGRLTKDPELRYTANSKPVASFTLAVDRDYTGKEGGDRQTDFIPCIAWNATAEFVSKYFHKGNLAVLSGRLQLRDWTDKDGSKHRVAEVIVANIYFAEKKQEPGNAPGTQEPKAKASAGGFAPAFDDGEGELPF